MAYSLLSNRKTNYPEIISKYGWYDALGYLDLGQTKAIHILIILGLDQGMFVVALTSAKTSGYVQKYHESVGKCNQLKDIYATLNN